MAPDVAPAAASAAAIASTSAAPVTATVATPPRAHTTDAEGDVFMDSQPRDAPVPMGDAETQPADVDMNGTPIPAAPTPAQVASAPSIAASQAPNQTSTGLT
eukprot:14283573-Alexandrium_andersonii.AAC.1